jgi:hypothetical protein
MPALKQQTREEALNLAKSKAIHRAWDGSKTAPLPPKDRQSTLSKVEEVKKTSNGKVIKDEEGNPIKSTRFHREYKKPEGKDPLSEASASTVWRGEGGQPDAKAEVKKEPAKKPEGKAKESENTLEPDAAAVEVAAKEVPAIAAWINANNPDVPFLESMKEAEKQGRKRPQAYTLLNKAIENRKDANQ